MLELIKRLKKDKKTRNQFLLILSILFALLLGYRIPLPGINTEYMSSLLSTMGTTGAGGILNAITGNAFSKMSIFALSVTPYISASIIVQLLGIIVPAIGRLSKNGSVGKQKIDRLTFIIAGVFSILESLGLAIGLGKKGLFEKYNWGMVIFAVIIWTAGSCFLVWIGQTITKKFNVNGVSLIMVFNILSTFPNEYINIYSVLSASKYGWVKAMVVFAMFTVSILMFCYVVVLHDSEKRIHITNSQKIGRFMTEANKNFLPLKLNMGGIMPIIFSSSIMSAPAIICMLFGLQDDSFLGKLSLYCNQSNWFNLNNFKYSIGILLFVPLTFVFLYFYIKISFSPKEIADNMRKNGSVVNGIRPGQPTAIYLEKQMKSMFVLGTSLLVVSVLAPIVIGGICGISNLGVGGTTFIIITSVVLELKEVLLSKTSSVAYKSLIK